MNLQLSNWINLAIQWTEFTKPCFAIVMSLKFLCFETRMRIADVMDHGGVKVYIKKQTIQSEV